MFRSCLLTMAAGLVLAAPASAAVQTKEVTYSHEGVTFKGHLAWEDAAQGKRPGVLVVHEWWGLNDYAKNRAKQLAEMGYVAFAADLYGDGKVIDTAHPNDAMAMVTTLRQNQKAWRGRAEAALKVLTGQPNVDASRASVNAATAFGGMAESSAPVQTRIRGLTAFASSGVAGGSAAWNVATAFRSAPA